MKKPIPAIATRALAMLEIVFVKERNQIVEEMADLAGVDLNDGWTLTENGTVFVKPDVEKPDGKPDITPTAAES